MVYIYFTRNRFILSASIVGAISCYGAFNVCDCDLALGILGLRWLFMRFLLAAFILSHHWLFLLHEPVVRALAILLESDVDLLQVGIGHVVCEGAGLDERESLLLRGALLSCVNDHYL